MYAKPTEPVGPDHYGVLELDTDAASLMIKKAYRRLALKYHPDKQAAGQVKDDSKFKIIQNAYETLMCPDQKANWEYEYPNIHEQWKNYRRDLADWEKRTAAEAEAEAEQARNQTQQEETDRRRNIWIMGEAQKARRVVEAEEVILHFARWGNYMPAFCYCKGCKQRRKRLAYERHSGIRAPTAEEYAEYMQMKQEEAECRQQETMRKRREEQDAEARERIKKAQEKADRIKRAEERKRAAKEKVKAARSSEAMRRRQEENEKKAIRDMAMAYNAERRSKFLAMMREEGKKGDGSLNESYTIDLQWRKIKCATKCLFCEEQIKYYAFQCPEGGATACNPCLKGMGRVTAAELVHWESTMENMGVDDEEYDDDSGN
ncbi:DnaJ domain-containing protein [Paraphoma chrysanthemicola]|nr:DnaJ domain-containing protein [Paraphoma chrysanthemicola]